MFFQFRIFYCYFIGLFVWWRWELLIKESYFFLQACIELHVSIFIIVFIIFFHLICIFIHLYSIIYSLCSFLIIHSLYTFPLSFFFLFFSIFSSTPLGNFPIDLAALNLNGSTWLQIKIQTASRFERQFLFLYRRSDGFCSLS